MKLILACLGVVLHNRKSQDKILNILRTKKALSMKLKAFLIIFQGLLLKQVKPTLSYFLWRLTHAMFKIGYGAFTIHKRYSSLSLISVPEKMVALPRYRLWKTLVSWYFARPLYFTDMEHVIWLDVWAL